jgi:RNA polymerase-interacting CarD/CdnL/TRCF family regulator
LAIKLKVGSKFVERGEVYEVFKICKGKIYYRPFFAKSRNNSFVCSIPRENLEMINIRKPITKSELKEVLKSLSRKSKAEIKLDITAAKSTLNLNQIDKSVSVIRRFWAVKTREGDGFTRAKGEVLKLAVSRIVEEVALVGKLTPEKAEEKIKLALG